MGFFNNLYNKPGPGIPKDAPKKKGIALFFEILWRELFELIKLNLLYIVFCIPIVTIPAATAAMTKITTKMVRDENYFMWTDFWATFKKEMVSASLGGWLLLFILLISGTSASFYFRSIDANKFMIVPLVVSLVVGFIALLTSFYFYPMVSSIDLPLKEALKNSALLSIVCLAPNLMIGAIFIVATLATSVFLFPAIPLMLVIECSLLNFISTFVAYGGIRKYVLHEDDAEKQKD